jgi:hypothetical protein
MVQRELKLYGRTLAEFNNLFYLSEDSPSGLRWKVSTSATAQKDSIAGSFSETTKFPLWRTKVDKQGMIVSRIVWFMYYKEVPNIIDHKDGNTRNNSIDNLRNVKIKVNCENRVVQNPTGHSGVYLIRNGRTWRCQGSDSSGKRWSKCFSVKKYGLEGAKNLCIAYRKQKDIENDVQTREVTLNDFR